ncbi:SCO3242 family prenyltransferase [Streptomyces sp. NPDC059597]|uniref:SCO3242 family prenyltransferase n=1 Tax=Streptomyces sp. NPDC059597 TaxID=3346879 RepID=UPI003676D6D9
MTSGGTTSSPGGVEAPERGVLGATGAPGAASASDLTARTADVADEDHPPVPAPSRPGRGSGRRSAAWAELLRIPALFTVPGDVLAGSASATGCPGSRTLWAIGSSLCLYEAGMVLNDWADRAEDAAERPHRPLPSGRIRPAAALTAACALTATGLALAARSGRPALAVAAPLAATVWAYDLGLKHTPAGPAAMATARALDLLLGAAAGSGHVRPALPSAALLGTHTLALTAVSRRETRGGAPLTPLAALAATGVLTRVVGGWRTLMKRELLCGESNFASLRRGALPLACALAYAATAARPYLHAALNPSPPLTQRAVGGGIRATIPLQAALCARSGAPVSALITAALAPLAARFAKRVSVT